MGTQTRRHPSREERPGSSTPQQHRRIAARGMDANELLEKAKDVRAEFRARADLPELTSLRDLSLFEASTLIRRIETTPKPVPKPSTPEEDPDGFYFADEIVPGGRCPRCGAPWDGSEPHRKTTCEVFREWGAYTHYVDPDAARKERDVYGYDTEES